MQEIEQLLNVPHIDSKTNFWMIRTKRGFFFDEFLKESFIAIGWNLVTGNNLQDSITKSQRDHLKELIAEHYQESKPGTALNKCLRFKNEMKEGDIVAIIDQERLVFAYVGEYFECNSDHLTVENELKIHQLIETAKPRIDSFDCPYKKRRKIKVIRYLDDRSSLNPYLQIAFAKNLHSLSDLNEYAELLLSECFGTFVYLGKMIVTCRVKTEENINALDLAKFILSATHVLSENENNIQVKTSLHSPGHITFITDFTQSACILMAIFWVAVSGAKIGPITINPLLPKLLDMYERVRNSEVIDREIKARVELKEQELLGKKLDNVQKGRRMLTSEKDIEQLDQIAQILDIELSLGKKDALLEHCDASPDQKEK